MVPTLAQVRAAVRLSYQRRSADGLIHPATIRARMRLADDLVHRRAEAEIQAAGGRLLP